MHVWQYDRLGFDYTVESLYAQYILLVNPYDYGYDNGTNGNGSEEVLRAAGGNLEVFNVEGQAQIIMHYYERRYIEGMNETEYAPWQPYVDQVYTP
jgi:uncharacterized membrane protein YfhO